MGNKILFMSFTFNPFDENTYIIHDPVTLEAAVIDPGCFSAEEEKEIESYIKGERLNIKYLINTHCHIDHIYGNNFVNRKYNPEYLIPEKDLFLLENAQKMGISFGVYIENVDPPTGFYDESTKISLGEFTLKPLFTPGHTPGEYCLYEEKSGILIAGDVLFEGSIGRTDLWGGNHQTLLDSIHSELLILPDETIVLPGHGNLTRIGVEREHNPFLQ